MRTHSEKVTAMTATLQFAATAVVSALVVSGCQTLRSVQHATNTAPPAVKAPAAAITTDSSSTALAPTIITGTGEFAHATSHTAAAAASSGEGLQLQFTDVDIAGVVSAVLGEGLGLPYTIDPAIKGTMSLQSARPLAKPDVLAALEAALRLQDIALVNANGTYRVVPLKDAPRTVNGIRKPDMRRAGFSVQVVQLDYTTAADMEKVLQPFAPPGSILRTDEGRNLLVLAGTSQELANLMDVIQTFDVDWLKGMSFALIPLKYVDPKTLANELGEIFAAPRSPLAGLVRLVPISRLNSVLVVTPQAKYLAEVQVWVERLDLGGTSPGRRIYVYDVQNGKAGDLANSLNNILSLSDESATTTSAGTAGASGTVNAAPSFTRRGANPIEGSGGATALDSGALKIVPNEESNALLILATPSEFGVIESALGRLDVLPRQVLIEASLAEVTLTDDMRYGVQWSYQGGDGPVVLSESGNGGISQRFPGFSYLFTGREDIRAVLNAIESITHVDVISSPKLLVLNNREAQLQIGDQVPVAVQSALSTGSPGAPIVNSVEFRDTGVILRVTPRVNQSGLVLMDIAQEVSDVVPTTTSGIDSPTIQQRKITSTVAVHSGETIALGGLIRDRKSKSRSGVPFLARIPLLGGLFRSTNDTGGRTELIVLITPRVIRDSSELDGVMTDLRNEFRKLKVTIPDPHRTGP